MSESNINDSPRQSGNPSGTPSDRAVPGANQRFGPGYKIGFVIYFVTTIVSFVVLIRAAQSDDQVAQARGMGYVLSSFGGGFVFALLYTIFTDKGIPWAVTLLGYSRTGVMDRRANPLAFWACSLISLLLAASATAAGVWISVNAEAVARALAPYAPR